MVIPCYNDGATLTQTLDSLSEEPEPFELVLVDDGSSEPETVSLLTQLEREGFKVVRQANAGLPAARMAGVKATIAPYVFPLDADDCLIAGSLGPLADALDVQPAAGVSYGDYETFGERETTVQTLGCLDPWLISYLNTMPVASLIRRRALIDSGGWSSVKGYEDWDLWMAMAERGWQGVKVPVKVFRYRVRSGRMNWENATRHQEIYLYLQSRHASLFRERERHRCSSSAPRALRILYPQLERYVGDPGRRKAAMDVALVVFGRLGTFYYLRRRLGRLFKRSTWHLSSS